MGQYHKPVSIEAEEGLEPHQLGCGLKTGEQLYTTPGTPQAMLALVTERGGNMPADCGGSPFVGRWAATRVLVQGDYADDGDIPGWSGPRLSELYGAVGLDREADKPTLADYIERNAGMALSESSAMSLSFGRIPSDMARPGTKRHTQLVRAQFEQALARWEEFNREHPDHPSYADIGDMAAAFLEGACSVRYFGDGWRSKIRVKAKAQKIAVGDWAPPIASYIPAEGYTSQDWDYLNGCGISERDWSRAPASGEWHGLLDSEVDQGQERVVVNLDTMEYLDPVTFGEVPTLGGMVRGEFGGVATALFAALVHPQRRGGGDIPAILEEMRECQKNKSGGKLRLLEAADGYVGRWRGGHILGTSAYGGKSEFPSTSEVRAKGRDVSKHAIAYLTAIKEW